MNMKKCVSLGSLLLFFNLAFTQTANIASLDSCYAQARSHTALAAQPALLRQQLAVRNEQIETSRLPDISLNGRATFQSENVDLGIDNPLFQSPDLPLFQYRATADATYTLYDGGYRQALLEQEKAASRTREQSVEVELYKLRERVNQPFFGVLLLRQKINLLQNTRSELQERIRTLQGAVDAGARLPGDTERLRVQVLRIDAEIDNAQHSIRGLLQVLGALTGQSYSEEVVLQLPPIPSLDFSNPSQRPELLYFQLQQAQATRAEALLDARLKPKVNAFAQVGLGAPNPLNFFDDNLSPFGIIGAQFTWKIADWQQTQRDRALLQLQRQQIEVQKDHFVQQLNSLDGKYREDLAALQSAIQRQDAIATVQDAIRNESAALLEQGVRTATDYLSDVNAALQTRIQTEALRLQVQQLKMDYLTLKGLL